MTRKEERFCLEYAVDYNGAAAARRAGYKTERAAKTASELLHRPEIMERVKLLQKEQAERLCLTSDLVVIRAMEMLDICRAAVPVTEWDYEEHKMVETGMYQIDSKGMGKALEILERIVGKQETVPDEPVIYSGEEEIRE